MGGNALKNTRTRRYTADEFAALAPDVLATLKTTFPASRVELVRAYRKKVSFGDMDVLVESAGLPADIGAALTEAFRPHQLVRNGNVWSLDVRELQVDLVFCPPEEFQTSADYFAYNDLGNLVGRIAHGMGFKYGHKGLLYPLRASATHWVEDVLVTRDRAAMLSFLGFDRAGADGDRFEQGFDTLEDMFAFVASSRYFDPSLYPPEAQSHTARTRDRKRPTYNAFLRWVAEQEPAVGVDGVSVRDKVLHLERAVSQFGTFAGRLADARHNLEQRQAARYEAGRTGGPNTLDRRGAAMLQWHERQRQHLPAGYRTPSP